MPSRSPKVSPLCKCKLLAAIRRLAYTDLDEGWCEDGPWLRSIVLESDIS